MIDMLRPLRMVLAVLVLVIAAAGVVPVRPVSPAVACSCVAMSLSEQVERSEVVLRGMIVSIEEPRVVTSSTQERAYVIEVTQVWRGTVGNPVRVHSAISGGSCGIEGWSVGDDVLLLGERRGDRDAATTLCSGSGQAESEHLKELTGLLGEPDGASPYKPGPPTWVLPVAVGGGLLLAAAIAVMLGRRLRMGDTP